MIDEKTVQRLLAIVKLERDSKTNKVRDTMSVRRGACACAAAFKLLLAGIILSRVFHDFPSNQTFWQKSVFVFSDPLTSPDHMNNKNGDPFFEWRVPLTDVSGCRVSGKQL